MRKAVFVLVSLLTAYIAGMYRLMPLTTMFVAEAILFISMFVVSRIMLLTTRITLCPPETVVRKGETAVCSLCAVRRLPLPPALFRVRLRYRYERERKSNTRVLYGSRADMLALPVIGRYCGLLRLEIDRLRVYDYLQLFSPGRRIAAELTVPVFPRARCLRFERSAGSREATVPEESIMHRSGESDQEIRQLREYRPGDERRSIHWNQSAKTDSLWIKEYESQEEPGAVLLIDRSAGQPLDAAAWDAFYELLSAVLLGLLQCAAGIRVYWRTAGSAGIHCEAVYDPVQCQEVLLHLYRDEAAAKDSKPLEMEGTDEDHLRLTTQLALYRGAVQLARFTQGQLDSEIGSRIIMI